MVIGATSLLILMGDLGRLTRDVDLTVALDFDEFGRLTTRLAAIGWTPSPKLEHRWLAPRQTIVDILPAGAVPCHITATIFLVPPRRGGAPEDISR